jgi:hypothetical protein
MSEDVTVEINFVELGETENDDIGRALLFSISGVQIGNRLSKLRDEPTTVHLNIE